MTMLYPLVIGNNYPRMNKQIIRNRIISPQPWNSSDFPLTIIIITVLWSILWFQLGWLRIWPLCLSRVFGCHRFRSDHSVVFKLLNHAKTHLPWSTTSSTLWRPSTCQLGQRSFHFPLSFPQISLALLQRSSFSDGKVCVCGWVCLKYQTCTRTVGGNLITLCQPQLVLPAVSVCTGLTISGPILTDFERSPLHFL